MIKVVTLIFLIANYRAFTQLTPTTRALRLLLLIFLLERAVSYYIDSIVAFFGETSS